jgi:hypothetical protein
MKMAPSGSHVVARQARISKNRIKYFVKAHIRKNRGKKLSFSLKIFSFSIGTEIENIQILARSKVTGNFLSLNQSSNSGLTFGKSKD